MYRHWYETSLIEASGVFFFIICYYLWYADVVGDLRLGPSTGSFRLCVGCLYDYIFSSYPGIIVILRGDHTDRLRNRDRIRY